MLIKVIHANYFNIQMINNKIVKANQIKSVLDGIESLKSAN